MEFQDELAGGIFLVRPALRSPGYVAGTSGWTINVDGSAEFNNVTVRGTLQSSNFVAGSAGWQLLNSGHAEFNDVTIRGATQVGGKSLYYTGTPALGNLLLSIAGTAGTDSFGNAYVQGLGVYSSDGQLQADGSNLSVTGSNGSAVSVNTGGAGQANVNLTPRNLGGTTWSDATVYTTLGASSRPGLGLISPNATVNAVQSGVEFYGGGPTTSDTYILFTADRVNFNNNVDVVGTLTAGNRVVGSVLITPSAANTPTSATVNYGPLTGSTFRGVASTESTVPGTQVTGWAISSITSTSALVWVTRTNTTATRVDYIIEGF